MILPSGEGKSENQHQTCLDASDLRDQSQKGFVAVLDNIYVDVEVDLVASKLVKISKVVPHAAMLVFLVHQADQSLFIT